MFSQLGDKRLGYTKENVTCSMHAAAYHVPRMVQTYHNIEQFSGQGKCTQAIVGNVFIIETSEISNNTFACREENISSNVKSEIINF